MRRFITSLPGKAVGQLVVAAMLLPTLTLMLIGKAQAQLTTQPTWAVLPFVVDPKAAGVANLGSNAADAVASEFSKTNLYDVVPQEQIKRAADNLGLTFPLTDKTSILRLAQEVRASTVVTGEVVAYRIVNSGGGKQAVLGMNVTVYDVASGLPINGAGVVDRSTVRVGNVQDDTLVGDALGAAANDAVGTIRSQTLPTGTILNTTEQQALINQGTRSGFKIGQKVVVVRGREQVATGTINDVEPDQAYLHPDRVIKGVEPGDKVRVIFDYAPVVTLDQTGRATRAAAPHGHNNSGFIQVLLLVALGAVLFTGGRANSQNGASNLVAEAEMYPDPTGDPSVKLHWGADIFVRANSTRVQWQIWRNDVPDSPVLVIQGNTFQAHDVSTLSHAGQTYAPLSSFPEGIGGVTCQVTSVPATGVAADAVGPAPGHAYQYRIELVYRISSLDLPNGGTGGTTGTTASTTGTGLTTGSTGGTTTGSTGGTTTGSTGGTTTASTGGTTTSNTTGTGGGQDCFFLSAQTYAQGLATDLVRSIGQSPAQNASIPKQVSYDPSTQNITFSFSSANTAGANLTLQYVVEESLSPTFPKNQTSLAHIPGGSAVAIATTNATNVVSLTTNNDLFQDVAAGTQIFWRVGVRNVADNPGPVPDTAGFRYVVGPTQFFVRAETPPPPPGVKH